MLKDILGCDVILEDILECNAMLENMMRHEESHFIKG